MPKRRQRHWKKTKQNH